MNALTKIIAGTIGVFGVLAVAAVLFALPVWLLWNAVVPQALGVHEITLVQALWLNLLCSFLFKSSSK